MNPNDQTFQVALAALLGMLAPAHPLAVAARAGLEVGALRAGSDRDDYIGGKWHREHPPAESPLLLRRYPPTGCRDLWVKYGPDGPPGWGEQPAAREVRAA